MVLYLLEAVFSSLPHSGLQHSEMQDNPGQFAAFNFIKVVTNTLLSVVIFLI